MWRATTFTNDRGKVESHVYPVVDVWDHEESSQCWCHPTAEPVEGGVLWHHKPQMPQSPATVRRTARA